MRFSKGKKNPNALFFFFFTNSDPRDTSFEILVIFFSSYYVEMEEITIFIFTFTCLCTLFILHI